MVIFIGRTKINLEIKYSEKNSTNNLNDLFQKRKKIKRAFILMI